MRLAEDEPSICDLARNWVIGKVGNWVIEHQEQRQGIRLSFQKLLHLLVAYVALALAVFVGPQASAQTIDPSSGKAMCSALTAADFNKAGVPVSGFRQANLDSPANVYCLYDSKTGKVEFDIFYPAGATIDAVKATENTVLREIGGKFETVRMAGVDEAKTNALAPKEAGFASIAVRKGRVVFDINIPQSAQARRQLLALAEIVASRLQQ
jgi:hypothetical protein